MPEFYEDSKLNVTLLELALNRPECVQDNVAIYGFYGNFPNSIWNGGRMITGMPCDKKTINSIFNVYNNYFHIPLRLTFTNPAIDDEKYCYDTYSNLIAECGHNGMNEILVASPILEEYLRKHYPNYKYCRSIVAAEKVAYNTDNYYMSVVNRNWVNTDKMNSIPEHLRSKIEVICNDACIDNCPRTYEHYQAIGKSTLNFQMTPEATCTMIKAVDADFPMKDLSKTSAYVDPSKIQKEYLPKGYQYFKLCGRENPAKRRMNWMKYIFKPEYQEDIFQKIWNIRSREK